MPWQELIGHVTDSTVRVRSRKGKEYPAETETDRLNDAIYSQLINSAHDDVNFWAWVEFDDGNPVVKDYARGDRPQKAPWEYP